MSVFLVGTTGMVYSHMLYLRKLLAEILSTDFLPGLVLATGSNSGSGAKTG
jgi:hypothetical protein